MSGIETGNDLGLPTATPTPEPAPLADELVAALISAAGRNRTTADNSTDPGMARLLASIGAAQLQSAANLARVSGQFGPEMAPVVIPAPEPPAPEPDPEATETPEPEVEVEPETPIAELPRPVGLTTSDFQSLVLWEDSTRFALEMLSARTPSADREPIMNAVASHGRRAQAWADLGGLSGTEADPRQLAYSLPRDRTLDEIERAHAETLIPALSSLISQVEPGSRALLIDLLFEQVLVLASLGQTAAEFPGMPELPGLLASAE